MLYGVITNYISDNPDLFARKEKIVTYKDSLQFPMTGWRDVTDWPPLDSLASQGFTIIGVSLEKVVEAADKETRAAFDKFRNEFVQQNCHRDVEIRTWDTLDIPDMGHNQSIFISTFTKNQTPFMLSMGCFLALGAACLSCPLRTYLRSKTKLYTVKVKKIYYYDPKKPSPVPSVQTGAVSVELPLESLDCSQQFKLTESTNNLPSFLPSRAFSIEVENLSFRKVS